MTKRYNFTKQELKLLDFLGEEAELVRHEKAWAEFKKLEKDKEIIQESINELMVGDFWVGINNLGKMIGKDYQPPKDK